MENGTDGLFSKGGCSAYLLPDGLSDEADKIRRENGLIWDSEKSSFP